MDRIVAFIPVRGGSKSIPLKNIKSIAGKPLVFWTVEAALNCPEIDIVYISTDSPEIRVALEPLQRQYIKLRIIERGVETATDTASTESAMLEFAKSYYFENIILIQATSPLLQSHNLTNAVVEYDKGDCDSLLSVVRQKRFIWNNTPSGLCVPVNYDFSKRPRRQEFDGFLVENGAFYITSRAALLETNCRLSGKIRCYEMEEESYFEIDEPSDFIIIEQLLRKRLNLSITSKIKLFATDVDGVLTDCGMYYTENGDELKKFNTRDGKGIELLRKAGIKTAIITSENTKIVERRGSKLKFDYVFQGIKDKLQVIQKLANELNINLNEIAYIGDDLNDMEVLSKVGLSACPEDAIKEVKNIVNFKSTYKGGQGCVREFCELILQGSDEKENLSL